MAYSKKRTIAIILVICMVVTIGVISAGYWIKNMAEKKISDMIPGEKIAFSSLDIHFLTSGITVRDASTHLKKSGADIYFRTIEIKGFHFWKWIKENKIGFDSMYAKGGDIEYEENYYRFTITNIDITGNNDSVNVSINEASVIPRYNKIAFGKRAGHQVDRMEMKLNKIQLKNISTGDLIKQRLKAHTFSIHHLNVSVFRDRRLPRRKETQYLPVEMIRQIPVPVHLDTFKIDNGVVEYEEFPKEGDHTGTLKIENAGITITPFITHHLKGDPDGMRMTTKGSIMGSGNIFASIYLPFHSDNYKVKGAIENLDLTKLNDGSENLGKIHIKSGFLDSLGFDFSFNKVKSSGKIVGVYHQLVIQPLKNHSDKKKIAKFKSFVLRHLIIPLNKDRSLAEKKRTGEIDYPYDPTRKVSYYLLQSLLTGIKSSFKLGFLLPK